MAIKISGTTVIDDSRNVTDVENVGDSNTVYYGNGANLTGIQAGSTTLTASGAISNGDPVVINSNGTVSSVAKTGTAGDGSAGSLAYFFNERTTDPGIVYDPVNKKIVIAFANDEAAEVGRAVVGTVSGTSISFGDDVSLSTSATSSYDAVYDSANQKVVIVYQDADNSYRGTAIVGTVSGDSITFGSSVAFNGGTTYDIRATYDSTNERVVIIYRDSAVSPNRGTAIVGTVSGNSITFGSEVTYNNALTSSMSVGFDSTNGKVVVAYRDGGDSNKGYAIVGTVSDTSISFGSEVKFEDASISQSDVIYDSTNGKIVIIYNDGGNSGYATAIVGTVSGTSISFGTAVVYNSASVSYPRGVFASDSGKVVISYEESSALKAIVGSVSGTSISFNTEFTIDSNGTRLALGYDSDNGKAVVAARIGNNSGRAAVITPDGRTTNLTSENYIGIAAAAISDGASGSINIAGGINASQSSLTAGKKIFVNSAGGVSENNSFSPSVVAGTSISSTKIAVKTIV